MFLRTTSVLFLLFLHPVWLLSQKYDFYFDALVKTHQIRMATDSTIYLYSECFMIRKTLKYNGYTVVVIDQNSEPDYFKDTDTSVVYGISPLQLEKGEFWLFVRPFYVTISRKEDLKNHKTSINIVSTGGPSYKFRLIKKRTKKKFKMVLVEKIER